MSQTFYAHSLQGRPIEEWQRIETHLKNVAQMAARFAEPFDAAAWAYPAGLWHDLGKYDLPYQVYIGASGDENHRIKTTGRHDHSTAGAKHAVSISANGGKLLAYLIAGHHAGLPDGLSDSAACLTRRLKKEIETPPDCPSSILNQSIPEKPPFPLDMKRLHFQIPFFARMLYSCLVDADFLDTEAFMDEERSGWRTGYPALAQMDHLLDEFLERLISSAPDTPVNAHRKSILDHCIRAADQDPGLFSLTVPTGGGKTLSSLSFALKHALNHGMERIIYVIPFTSIIEQNAAVFREVLGDSAVLEHHSNFEAEGEDRRSRLAAENWDAPLVVTTNVQFFESLFHNRSSRCRKLHNIANSVIILDEAQMLPPTLLKPCIEALRELTENYRASIVLCTATQPALEKREDFAWGLENVREIMPDPPGLYDAFRRTEVSWLGPLSDDELAEQLSKQHQVLCIVGTRKHAREVFEKVSGDSGRYHLTALMCPAHRTERLKTIREALARQEPCIVVSTSLVEAGVNVDFPVVYRAAAGLDSIAQAAGRCNREGKMAEPGKVFVFMPEPGLPPGDFRQNAETGEMVARRYEDLLSLDAIREYFETLFWRKGDSDLDRYAILDMLREGVGKGNFPFKTVAEIFQLIRDDSAPIIIPYDQVAEGLIQGLRYTETPGWFARKLQRYTVQIPPRALSNMEAAGSVEWVGHNRQFCVLINPDLYRDDVGLCPEDPWFHNVESLIF
jgi:CRISPR-associated endonuclease/helicase Cas3